MRYQIIKVRNCLWRLETENGLVSEHSTKYGAEKALLQLQQRQPSHAAVDEWLKELHQLSYRIRELEYQRGADKARGLTATKERVALDNLATVFNDKLKDALDAARAQAFKEAEEIVESVNLKMPYYECNLYGSGALHVKTTVLAALRRAREGKK